MDMRPTARQQELIDLAAKLHARSLSPALQNSTVMRGFRSKITTIFAKRTARALRPGGIRRSWRRFRNIRSRCRTARQKQRIDGTHLQHALSHDADDG